ncbi:MAG: OPT/YSL family transporter [Myxococcales bacterium]|nr:OPT/YSL family transporter [Myxococcales bacterium]
MRGFWPRLSVAEWITFALLAGTLSVTNIYTTLLTGWGDGGSIIAVIASALILGIISRKHITVESLNLGQTMASAGGSVGFSVCAFAAVKMVDPTFAPDQPTMMVLFVAMGVLGALVGASVRKQMVKYFFPSGTACAVIQRTLTSEGETAKRPVRLLLIWGSLSALITIPTKIALKKGEGAILHSIEILKEHGIGLAVEPLLYGIGIVVGPRIGLGMLLGALAGSLVIIPTLKAYEFPPSVYGDWVKWMAISVLTVPAFATIAFAYLYRVQPETPAGFSPGATEYAPPASRPMIYGVLGFLSIAVTAYTCQLLFGLSWLGSLLTIALSWPLCIMNGRVTGDTDINPVRLVAIVILTVFAWIVGGGVVAVLGMAIIGGTLAGMAVDMMQDYRTGFLVDANPHHQTTVQLIGTVVGALAAVPFILYLDKSIGFGPGTSLVAPGAQIWSAMAKAFAGGAALGTPLITACIAVSVGFVLYAWLTVNPKSARYMPSLFGIGIGMLLPFEMSAAIFVGGLIRWITVLIYRGRDPQNAQAATVQAGEDTMLVGSSVFAASAVISVVVVLIAGLGWVHLAE